MRQSSFVWQSTFGRPTSVSLLVSFATLAALATGPRRTRRAVAKLATMNNDRASVGVGRCNLLVLRAVGIGTETITRPGTLRG
jgi:hypothetical protein